MGNFVGLSPYFSLYSFVFINIHENSNYSKKIICINDHVSVSKLYFCVK